MVGAHWLDFDDDLRHPRVSHARYGAIRGRFAATSRGAVARLPELTGPYKVLGVMRRHLKDPRTTSGPLADGVLVKIFYPAKVPRSLIVPHN